MIETALGNRTIKLPVTLVETISNREILSLLLDKALGKREYYRSKCRTMEDKHHTNFPAYKRSVEETREENFTEWDDLILWEGYEIAYQEWSRKFEELRLGSHPE